MMSFSKAGIKRFNENAGCAPPVGAYDPKDSNKKKAATLGALKSDRFKAPKDITPGPGAFNVKTTSFIGTPSKKGSSDVSVLSQSVHSGCRKPAYKQSLSSASSVESLSRESVSSYKGLCERCQQLAEQCKNSRDWVQSLQKCRDSLSAQKKRMQEKLRELEQETWEKGDTIRFLKGEVSAITDNLLHGDQTLFEANAEIAEYKEKIIHLEEEECTINENIQVLTEKYHLLEKELAEEQNCGKKRVSELKSRLDVTSTNLAEVTEQCGSLELKNKELLQSLHKEKEDVEKLVYQIDEQKKTASDLNSVLECKEETITDLEIQLEATKIELSNTKELVDQHQQKIEDLQHKITSLKAVESQLKEELERESDMNKETARHHADRIMELEASELSMKEEQSCQSRDLSNAVLKCEQLEDQVSLLRSEVNQLKEEFEETLNKIKVTKDKEISELMETVDHLKEEKESLEKQIDNQTSEISSLYDQIKCLQEDKTLSESEMEKSKEDLQKIINTQVDTMRELRDKLEKLCEEKKDLLKRLDIATVNKETLEDHLETLKQKVEEVESGAHQKELEWRDDFQRLTMELQEITEEKDILHQKITVTDGEKDQLYETLQQTDKHLSQQKTFVENLSRDVEKLMFEKSEVEKNVETMTTKCNSLQKENNDLMNEIDYLQSSNAHLKSQSTEETDNLKKQFNQITEENNSLKVELELSQRQQHGLRKELSNSQKEHGKLTEEMTHFKTEISSEQCQRKSLQEEVQKLSKQKETLHDEITDLNKKLSTSKTQYESLTEINTSLHEQLMISNSQNESLSGQIVQLKDTLSGQLEKQKNQSAEITTLQKQIEDCHIREQNISSENNALTEKLTISDAKITSLEQNLVNLRKILEKQNHDLSRVQSRSQTLEENFSTATEKLVVIETEKMAFATEVRDLKSMVNDFEMKERKHKEELLAVQEQLASGANREEVEALAAQCEKWKKLYDDLQVKIEPFKEQLDAFELERQSLLGQSQYTQNEMEKLSKDYARLLGHQNQKQKIHHVLKLKEENNSLKREASSLRVQLTKEKRTITKLEEKVKLFEGRKRFDPSKAFAHSKENEAPPSPLKDGNRSTAV